MASTSAAVQRPRATHRWFDATITRSPARLSRAIDSGTPGSILNSLQDVTYRPSGIFSFKTPSRSRNTAVKERVPVLKAELATQP